MYADFFGFREPPFTITPNPRFVFLSTNHREAFAHLLYGVGNHAGFIALTGEVGTGKTTLLRTFLGQLDEATHRTALIFNPSLTAVELLRTINQEYAIPWEGLSAQELLEQLNRFLLAENRAGRTVVLVIDEAQNLEPKVLEQIRLISNLETETDKLIQIVLAGQPELDRLLAQPELRQLDQRITVRYRLGPMDAADTEAYVRHRIEVAGGRGNVAFSQGALGAIYRFSGGIPRLVNIVCDRALLIAYTEERREVDRVLARRAVAEIGGERSRSRRVPVAVALLVLCLLAAGGTTWWRTARPTRPVQLPAGTVAAAARPAPDPPKPVGTAFIDRLRAEQIAVNRERSVRDAFAPLASAWKVAPLTDGEAASPDPFGAAAARRRLRVLRMTGSLDQFLQGNTPFILEYSMPGRGSRYLAVIGRDGERLRIAPPLLGSDTIGRSELETFWSGRGMIPWRNFQSIPRLWSGTDRTTGVVELQKMLRSAGVLTAKPSGIFDDETIAAVKRFQASRQIPSDGAVGSMTLILLYQAAGDFSPPTLSTAGKVTP